MLAHHARHAWRMWRSYPVLTAAAVASLAFILCSNDFPFQARSLAAVAAQSCARGPPHVHERWRQVGGGSNRVQ
jgi:hypothetical protein